MISVCMPYWSEGGRQKMLNRSLAAYRNLYDVEISICDDGSPDPVEAANCIVTTLPAKDHALNPCIAINRAVAASSGDVVVLTNPEIEHREDVFSSMLQHLGPGRYVTASCINPDGRWLAHSSVRPEGTNLRAPMPPGSQFHFCAMLYRDLWEKAGGFDEDYRNGQAFDDNDWLWRLERAGAEFVHLDDVAVYHYHTATRWPAGGWVRNARLLQSKWAPRWRKVFGEAA